MLAGKYLLSISYSNSPGKVETSGQDNERIYKIFLKINLLKIAKVSVNSFWKVFKAVKIWKNKIFNQGFENR